MTPFTLLELNILLGKNYQITFILRLKTISKVNRPFPSFENLHF